MNLCTIEYRELDVRRGRSATGMKGTASTPPDRARNINSKTAGIIKQGEYIYKTRGRHKI